MIRIVFTTTLYSKNDEVRKKHSSYIVAVVLILSKTTLIYSFPRLFFLWEQFLLHYIKHYDYSNQSFSYLTELFNAMNNEITLYIDLINCTTISRAIIARRLQAYNEKKNLFTLFSPSHPSKRCHFLNVCT